MPRRINFKSKFTFDEEALDNDVLSTLAINPNIDDIKKKLLNSILAAMTKHPELRLGQLLANTMSNPESCSELFYIEDKLVIKKIFLFYLK